MLVVRRYTGPMLKPPDDGSVVVWTDECANNEENCGKICKTAFAEIFSYEHLHTLREMETTQGFTAQEQSDNGC